MKKNQELKLIFAYARKHGYEICEVGTLTSVGPHLGMGIPVAFTVDQYYSNQIPKPIINAVDELHFRGKVTNPKIMFTPFERTVLCWENHKGFFRSGK